MDAGQQPEFPPGYAEESNAGRIVGVVGAFHFLAFLFVSLRLYVRVFMVKTFGVDDVLIILAVVSPRFENISFLLVIGKEVIKEIGH